MIATNSGPQAALWFEAGRTSLDIDVVAMTSNPTVIPYLFTIMSAALIVVFRFGVPQL